MSLKTYMILLAGLLMIACSPQHGSSTTEAGPTVAKNQASDNHANGEPAMPDDSNNLPQHLQHWHKQAREDLAQQLQLSDGNIVTVQAADVTWPDGAMGCPQPGMLYTQAQVPGYQLVFRVAGQQYYYHGQQGQPPFYCPADRAGKPLPVPPQTLT
ncbi:MAG: hypothetical protein PF630_01915 [Gammaproteobacteria bacterium]|jgi:hypothetical protein|nr:hypothetical protein [Gammaproteobacteria bacterium]